MQIIKDKNAQFHWFSQGKYRCHGRPVAASHFSALKGDGQKAAEYCVNMLPLWKSKCQTSCHAHYNRWSKISYCDELSYFFLQNSENLENYLTAFTPRILKQEIFGFKGRNLKSKARKMVQGRNISIRVKKLSDDNSEWKETWKSKGKIMIWN